MSPILMAKTGSAMFCRAFATNSAAPLGTMRRKLAALHGSTWRASTRTGIERRERPSRRRSSIAEEPKSSATPRRCTVASAACALIASDPLLDPRPDGLQRARQSRGVGAAGLRHVGPAAALAAHLLRHVIHELAGLHPGGEVCRHPGDQRNLAVIDGAEHDRGG